VALTAAFHAFVLSLRPSYWRLLALFGARRATTHPAEALLSMTNGVNTSPRLKWLVALLLAVVALLCGTIVYLLIERDTRNSEADHSQTLRPPPEPLFVKVGPMTVNLQGEGYGRQLLYIGLSLKTGDKYTHAALLRYMPELQSRLLILLSGQDGETLVSPEGKERLAGEIRALLDRPFAEGQPPLSVDAVLFTDFILQ